MTPAELKEIRNRLGLSASQMAAALSDEKHAEETGKPTVDSRTVRRWEDGSQDIPHPVVVAVKLMQQLADIRARLEAR